MKKLAIVSLFLIISSYHIFALTGNYGSQNGSIKVLLAYEPTRFKNRLVENLVELLSEKDYSITVIDHGKGELENYKAQDFDAVFITNSGARAMVRPVVTDWLEENGTDPENVFVHTTQTTVWNPEIEVDGTTSASLNTRNDIEALAKEFSDLLSEMIVIE